MYLLTCHYNAYLYFLFMCITFLGNFNPQVTSLIYRTSFVPIPLVVCLMVSTIFFMSHLFAYDSFEITKVLSLKPCICLEKKTGRAHL